MDSRVMTIQEDLKLTELSLRVETLTSVVISLTSALADVRDVLTNISSQPTLLLSSTDREVVHTSISQIGKSVENALKDIEASLGQL
jgi:hypothetical protein